MNIDDYASVLEMQVTRSPVAPNWPARSLHIIMGTCAHCCCCLGSYEHKYRAINNSSVKFMLGQILTLIQIYVQLYFYAILEGQILLLSTDIKRGMNDLSLVHLRFLT